MAAKRKPKDRDRNTVERVSTTKRATFGPIAGDAPIRRAPQVTVRAETASILRRISTEIEISPTVFAVRNAENPREDAPASPIICAATKPIITCEMRLLAVRITVFR